MKEVDQLIEKFGTRESMSLIRVLREDLDIGDSTSDEGIFAKAIQRVLYGEPVQYVTGRASFFGYFFKVNPSVLIPRPETEELVALALEEIPKNQKIQVLDIGTGSGCIAITIALERPNAEVIAVDISEKAIEVAQENATRLGVDVRFEKMDFLKMGWMELNWPKVDVVISNPPYVDSSETSKMSEETLSHEPGMALFPPGEDPLVFYRKMADHIGKIMQVGGRLFLEINEYRSREVQEIFAGRGISGQIIRDMQGKDRIFRA